MTLPGAEFEVDVAVIGGGVNGTGVLRDLTLRGMKGVLFERNDIAFGASGNSSGMIHGGPRYLTQDPEVTRTSCLDSGHIQSIAPHLLFRVPFLVPLGREGTDSTPIDLVDGFFEAYDAFQPLKRGKPHARLTPDELFELEPGLFGGRAAGQGDLVGGVSFDEWGIDGSRLCVANAVDAAERGARLYTHTTVEEILREPSGVVRGVRARDLTTGRSFVVGARAVVNATGAWSTITALLAKLPTGSARVRPGKGIHVVLDRRLTNYGIIARAIDGRQIFLEPWQNVTVLGTTDDDFYGDLDDVRATTDEVRYLVEGVAHVFPAVTSARAIGTTAGVRPTLYEYGPSEDELSRDHRVVDHAKDGAIGLFSMIGGKLASYRIFAELMTDMLVDELGHPATPCRTHLAPLPGGDRIASREDLAAKLNVDAVTAARLVYRHGGRSEVIALRVAARPREAAVVCPCEPVIEAEVRHVVQHEWAMTVDDVARRTRLGLGACGGMRCAARCGQIIAEERRLSPREGARQALRFLTLQSRSRAPAVGPMQAQQEALGLAVLRAELGPLVAEDE